MNDPGSGMPWTAWPMHADELNVLSEWAKEEIKKKSETTPSSESNSASPDTNGVSLEPCGVVGRRTAPPEASLQLDPPPEKWMAKAALQTAILKPGQVLYERDFYATESDKPDAPPQTTEEADKEAVKLNEMWPR